jgi:Tfp pilus assembly protein PilZ
MPACEDKVYNNPLFFEEQGFRRQTQDIFRILKSVFIVLVLLDYNLYIPFTIKWVKIDAKYPTSTIGVHLR